LVVFGFVWGFVVVGLKNVNAGACFHSFVLVLLVVWDVGLEEMMQCCFKFILLFWGNVRQKAKMEAD